MPGVVSFLVWPLSEYEDSFLGRIQVLEAVSGFETLQITLKMAITNPSVVVGGMGS